MNFRKLAAFSLSSAILIGSTTLLLTRPSTAWADHVSNHESTNLLVAQNPIKSGTFVTTEQDVPTTGKVTIVTENGKRYLDLDAEFSTAMGPAVKVILYRSNQVPVKELSEENYVVVAPLQSFSGAQRYAIPDDLDLEQFQAVGIWCSQFNVTFGYAAF